MDYASTIIRVLSLRIPSNLKGWAMQEIYEEKCSIHVYVWTWLIIMHSVIIQWFHHFISPVHIYSEIHMAMYIQLYHKT